MTVRWRHLGLVAMTLAVFAGSPSIQAQVTSGRMTPSGFATGMSSSISGGGRSSGLNADPNPGRISPGSGFRPPPGEGRTSLRQGGSTLREIIGLSEGVPVIIGENGALPAYNPQNLQRIRQRRSQQRRVTTQSARRPTVKSAQHSAAHMLTLGFIPDDAMESGRRAQDLAQRARSLQEQLGSEDLFIDIEGSKAILKGTVADDAQKRLVANIALLEPGIYQVDNQLSLRSSP